MTLLYFTESFPYGLGETWKENELNGLSSFFDRILVIPFHGSGEIDPSICLEKNIQVEDPLFSKLENNYNLVSVIRLGLSYPVTLIREISKTLLKGRYGWNQFFTSSTRIYNLSKHERLRKYLRMRESLSYFFWGRLTAEVLAVFSPEMPSVMRLHGYDLYKDRYPTGYIPFHDLVLRAADLLLPVSGMGKSYLISEWLVEPEKIERAPLGVRHFGMSKMSNDGVLRIFSCSSLIYIKRIDRLIESLKAISDIQIRWTHIGDGELMEDLRKQALDLTGNVTVHWAGHVLPREVHNYYVGKNCDLFVNCSDNEGVPVAIMEAMAAGMPVIAPDVGGISEIVNSENGILLNSDFTNVDLSDAILKFQSLKAEDVAQMRRAAREMQRLEYDARSNAKELGRQLSRML